jgi:hypothetical protein
MVGLLELQRQICGAVRGQEALDLPDLYRPDHLPPGHPLSVYRNNHLLSLAAALAATFPTVTRLIGAATMQGVATRFLLQHPPRQPCVAEYGSGFASHLESEPLADDLPYLPDLARLDWALNRARIAPDEAPFTAQDLSALSLEQLGALRVAPHPSLTLLVSSFALPHLHQAVHRSALEAVTVAEHSSSRLMIWRQHREVKIAAVSADAFAGAQALAESVPLSEACENLQQTEFAEFLAHFLCSGAFVGNSLPRTYMFGHARCGV